MSDPTSNDRPTNDRPTNGRNPNAHLADLESDAETGSAADAKKVAADARASATQGPNRAAAAGMPAEKPQDLAGSVKRLAGLMGPERIGAIMVVLLAIVSVTLTVIGPKVLGRATDVIFSGIGSKGGIDYTRLHNTLLLAVGLYLVAWILSYGQNYLLAGVVQRTMSRIRTDVEEKINRLPLSYVDRQPRGDLLSRVTNDIDNVAQSLQQTLGQMLTSLFTIVGVMVMMFIISPLLALVALITIPSALFLTKFIASRSKTKFIAQWKHTGTLNAQVEESFTGHALVKVFGRQAEAEEKFNEVNEELYEASFGAQFISGIIQPAMMFLGNLNFVAIAVIGGLRVASGALSLGDVQAFIQYSRQFTQPLTQVAAMANVFQSGVASIERVFALLDVDEESPDAVVPAEIEGTVEGRVEFADVSFSYDPDRPLIRDLSLVAEPGETVAIVGPTGAGKTTLVNLLMRFYDIDSGTITIDGVDVSEMTRHHLRASMGMVLQDTWLFGGTIRENIAYGNLEASEEEIMSAAKATYVDRFVRTLPDGYDTVIDDEGGNVSAGEKQLLTIARAFLAKPAILILDEATSSVDTRTEVLIQHAMAALRTNRTSFVIAHRLSTIRDADIILVMDDGHIVEQGNHDELLAAGGAYATLYNAQFAGAAREVV
ncbi:MAG: ABC transporter ATP-binding protein [Candidatus Microthrix parvicella]|jgi:ATP-binding cassette subfamily B protein|uniref:Fatty acid ABC transporter ATP-binding/permease protein n=3 Tax=Candidatus Neomicrothrix TaxID=41949 RepID=R4Z0P7_9ACTN|nr:MULTISPECIES: ABC transporter ATP-binding protein [Microthrix]MBK7321922.1 ABC transporter ATP-binding protein [Candidatus Microthrix sp.]CCM62826.1 putative ABC transporter (ATP-binding protein) [Candidatus Microthrix parvicella RN1]